MNTRSPLLASYGLKRAYQRNMLIGFTTAGLLFSSVFALASTWNREYKQSINVIIDDYPPDTLVVFPPLPPTPTKAINVTTEQPPEPPEFGLIIAVEDSLAEKAGEIPTQNQIASWVPNNPEFDPVYYTSEANIEKVLESLLPQPGVFVPYDEMPVAINQPTPIYPPLAQRAGIQGVVWINALVDKNGKVRDVKIFKESNANAGFEEAAIEAAYKTTWKPAIANGQPIALWVTYKVEFVLK
ncbi:MAG: TonB family protein [Candidatus Zixiibacteriota bacterium]|nr:MAG: TonB family protein [candidate division Zixibacteria bacterium]